jgi:hypothetical protein
MHCRKQSNDDYSWVVGLIIIGVGLSMILMATFATIHPPEGAAWAQPTCICE